MINTFEVSRLFCVTALSVNVKQYNVGGQGLVDPCATIFSIFYLLRPVNILEHDLNVCWNYYNVIMISLCYEHATLIEPTM